MVAPLAVFALPIIQKVLGSPQGQQIAGNLLGGVLGGNQNSGTAAAPAAQPPANAQLATAGASAAEGESDIITALRGNDIINSLKEKPVQTRNWNA